MGNGIYRLWIVIIGQFGTMILGAHPLHIFAPHGSSIINCFGLEYLISVLSAIYYSLTTCVAIEQAVVAYQHLRFVKNQSRHVAKIVIPTLIFYHFLVAFHEPFHHQLLSDIYFPDRRWYALHRHTGFLSICEKITNIVHFILPYTLNLFTPLIMLSILTKHNAGLGRNTTIWRRFKSVLYTYKNNLITPYLLVLLTTPCLILTFYLTCITQPW